MPQTMFQIRKKHMKRDPSLIPFPSVPDTVQGRILFDYSDNDKPVRLGTFEVIGEGVNSLGHKIEHLCITLDNGDKVPGHRVAAVVHTGEQGNYVVCQDFELRMIKANHG